MHIVRALALALVAAFVAGCWSEKIEIRTTADNDQIPYEARSKEKKALLKALGKAPPEAEAKPAEATEKPAEKPAEAN